MVMGGWMNVGTQGFGLILAIIKTIYAILYQNLRLIPIIVFRWLGGRKIV